MEPSLSSLQIAYLMVALGAVLLIFLVMDAFFTAIKLPPLIGYILLGWLTRTVGEHYGLLGAHLIFTFNVLSKIGVVLLLFHIGMDTNIKKLLAVVGKAGFVSIIEIIVSGAAAFLAAYFFSMGLAASLIVGLAMTATSIGVSTYSWNANDLKEKEEGAFLLDLASFDDIIGILLFSLLFGLIGSEMAGKGEIISHIFIFLLKLLLFIGGCYLFSHFVEKKLMTELIQYEKMPDSMLSIVGIGLLIAGVAALIDFSLVIGAFFAGIAFSRDPRSIRINASMRTLLDFFVPFFFFWIGYQIVLHSLSGAWPFFLLLLAAALFGKMLGVWVPSRFVKITSGGALLLSVSMIPRAEVTMVIMDHGLELNWINAKEYSVVGLIVLTTCVLGAILTKLTLKKTYSSGI